MLNDGTLVLDNTKRSCAQQCLRKFYWQHVLGLQPQHGSTALRFGSTWHAILEGYYIHIKENGWTRDGAAIGAAFALGKEKWEKETGDRIFYDDYRTYENCCQLFLAYMNHYDYDVGMLQVVSPEQTFRCPMPLDEEDKKLFPNLAELKDVYFTGQIDLQIKLNGSKWMLEHKTTGQPLSVQTQRLNRSAQIKGYTWASREVLSFSPEGTLISFAHLSGRRKKDGDYGKLKMDFARTPQVFSEEDLIQWRKSFLTVADDVAKEYKRGLWPCNDDACYNFGACPYIGLCEQNRSLDETRTDNFLVKIWDVENQ